MNVALIGFGIENQSAYRYWVGKGVIPTICDQNTAIALPEGATSQLGEHYLDNLGRFDVIVRTVGMHPQIILDKEPNVESKITTAVGIFFEECHTPIIGVTGTKGKGTTSTLITKILEAAGKKLVLAGNIGLPMLDILEQASNCDYVVLELSSFQLFDLKYSPQRAVCLMVVPEHLNWHKDYADYKHAKGNLFRYQNSDNVAIFNGLDAGSKEVAASSPASTKLTYAVPALGQDFTPLYTTYVLDDTIYYHNQPIMKTADVKLLGRHNLENVCAAITATWDITDGNVEAIRSVVSSFAGLEYRLQFIRELNGVQFINDSFSTTPETAIAALKAFAQPKIIILGGSDKGATFEELANTVITSNVKHVLAIGERGQAIAQALRNRDFVAITDQGLDSMPAIVAKARELTAPGDVVLLSTACASFDMFKDYKDRGKQFTDAVLALA